MPRPDLNMTESGHDLKRSEVLSFDDGLLTVKMSGHGEANGWGQLAFREEQFELDADGFQVVEIPPSELRALRDFLNRVLASPHPTPDTGRAGVIEYWADWLVDAVAGATQNRAFLRKEPEEDKIATEAIYLNGKKAIENAICSLSPVDTGRAHRVMTPEEYAALSIKGWHGVLRDCDGCGNVGVRYEGTGNE